MDGKGNFGKEARAKRWMKNFDCNLNRPPDTAPSRHELSVNCEAPMKQEIIETGDH